MEVTGQWRFAAAEDLVEGFRRGTVRTAAGCASISAAALPAIEAAIAQSIAAYHGADGFAVPIVAILASGMALDKITVGRRPRARDAASIKTGRPV